ncbi:MAG: ABC transporter ATP-binding protein [Porphyromonadaceae bacterium]|nr:ABC transporter ATP-binding protein [Porphyromonadaceae bacterium]
MPQEKNTKKKSILKRLLPYSGRRGYLLPLAMLCSALSGILVLMPMVYIHRIVSQIILSGSIGASRVWEDAVLAASLAAGGLLLYFLALLASHLFAFEVEQNIVKESVKKLLSKPLGFFVHNESGRLRKTIVDGAAETHSMLAHQLPDLAMTITTPIVLLVFLFLFDWRLGLASAVPLVISLLLMGTMMTKANMAMRDEYYSDLAALSAEAVEYVRCIPVVKTFAQSIESFERLYTLIMKSKALVVRWSMSFRNKMSLYEALVSSTAFFLVPIAILLIQHGGDLRQVLGHSVIYLLIGPTFGIFVMRSATIHNFVYFAELALDKIDACLEGEALEQGALKQAVGGLAFRNVCFSYGQEQVLRDVSFEVKPGERIALVGPSGGGKTTIARLAARFYDADQGDILIGGVNIKEYEQAALMQRIAFVFQNSKLFKMTLRENLLLARPEASEEELEQALIRSGAQEIIQRLDKGLETVYGQRGTYLSGGEAQRICIARALLKDADLVILDEATAFADPENEHIIQASLGELSKGKTTLMIAHRLSSVIHADRILVIDQGTIAESGTHQALLDQGGIYKKLWDEYQRAAHWKIGGNHD